MVLLADAVDSPSLLTVEPCHPGLQLPCRALRPMVQLLQDDVSCFGKVQLIGAGGRAGDDGLRLEVS